jgi:hypothetical protein
LWEDERQSFNVTGKKRALTTTRTIGEFIKFGNISNGGLLGAQWVRKSGVSGL